MDQLASLLRLIGPRAARTNTNPNAWSIISVWRRYFQYQEELEEQQVEELAEGLAEAFPLEVMRPIATESNRALRTEMMQEYRRELRAQGDAYTEERRTSNEIENQRRLRNQIVNQWIDSPDLSIPVGTYGTRTTLPQ